MIMSRVYLDTYYIPLTESCTGYDEFQIAGLLKDNEKIQSNPEVPPSEDDTEIKKIKKVICISIAQF